MHGFEENGLSRALDLLPVRRLGWHKHCSLQFTKFRSVRTVMEMRLHQRH